MVMSAVYGILKVAVLIIISALTVVRGGIVMVCETVHDFVSVFVCSSVVVIEIDVEKESCISQTSGIPTSIEMVRESWRVLEKVQL